MSKDEIVFASLVIAFAAFVTSHVALCFGRGHQHTRSGLGHRRRQHSVPREQPFQFQLEPQRPRR